MQSGSRTEARIRHVKCDEEKPECTQCCKTGRKCDGYEKLLLKKQDNRGATRPAPMVHSSGHVVLLPGTLEEWNYVHFFCTQTTRAMSGIIPMLYWSSLKCRDPLVRRRALAVLSRGPQQEGLWRKKRFLKVTGMVIDLEEQDMLP
ncbi:Zn(II)2Cys6 transcription factor domain-containing protein [Aspergillus melleus]|uniref:Zn(II)2Cys6 transcription factor domain-containing protein n=1 Tax=Aspergillus melleus TaxID=138277 RepID=UPI001E8CC7E2|nr:uncharacterized protein LDX57_002655 [Aspergillus melleus]KAH8424909.1 hypothetical protein LDX57_002655 [Aspergillus melleus]